MTCKPVKKQCISEDNMNTKNQITNENPCMSLPTAAQRQNPQKFWNAVEQFKLSWDTDGHHLELFNTKVKSFSFCNQLDSSN